MRTAARRYATAAAAAASSSSSAKASPIASLLRTSPAAALDTPGLTFTNSTGSASSNRHPHAPAQKTANINMCTVRIRSSPSQPLSIVRNVSAAIVAPSSLSLSPSLSLSSSRHQPSLRSFSTSTSSRATPATAPSAASSSAIAAPLPPLKKVRKTYSPDRKYPQRKTFLYNAYARLLSSSNLLVLLQYGNLTVAEWNKLRADLAAVPLPAGSHPGTPRAGIVAVRAALLSALLKSHPNKQVQELSHACSGPLAFLYFPTAALVSSVASERKSQQGSDDSASPDAKKEASSPAQQEDAPPTIDDIDPRYVEKVLVVLDRAFGGKAVPAPPRDLDPFSPAATAGNNSGLLGNPRLLPLGALFYPARAVQPAASSADGDKPSTPQPASSAIPAGLAPVPESEQPPTRLLPVLSLRAIASHLPDIHTLRAQMVGLLGAPAQSLVGVLSSAGGAGLVRVLKGYVATLEKEGEGSSPSKKEDGAEQK
ncbi:unnamed protein product [Tilletia controversa]|nr:unnamed protein product [Tilletia caries]CAD6954080.1 unnamed protein product [Tilletia controversa]CAD6948862.1 unnamed protein product [Tilletia caries]CAD6959358.1 unnamed protein product [Tilletia caries]CAD6961638.1 unnamed protein product [Tilletia controversa]